MVLSCCSSFEKTLERRSQGRSREWKVAFRNRTKYCYERSEFLAVGDGKKSTQKNVRRRRTGCNYWSIKSMKTTVRRVLPIYSGARDPSGER